MSKTDLDPQVRSAALLSVIVATSLFIIKFYAFRITGSQALFSEAMESIVNVLAGAIAFFVVYYAAKPADKGHPYGHGKAEYLSAALEGGLIAFAAFLIVIEAVQAFFEQKPLQQLSYGALLLASTGIINLVVGFYLNRLGVKKHSAALEASGKHLMADFWTTTGVLVGLALVILTGVQWLDTLIAVLVGVHLVREGFQLVRKALGGLLDEEQQPIIKQIQSLINAHRQEGIIQVHHLRVMRSGSYHHIDAHVVVPEFWSVETAHDQANIFEKSIVDKYEYGGEIHFHMDPCRRLYCKNCDVRECSVRKEEFVDYRDLSLDELISKEEPGEA